MINTLNDLRLKWRAQQQAACDLSARTTGEPKRICLEQAETLSQCISDLIDAVDSVRPIPLNEASTEKLYLWSNRMITIFDLMIKIRNGQADGSANTNDLASAAYELGSMADQTFLNDLYDLFKQLSNRR